MRTCAQGHYEADAQTVQEDEVGDGGAQEVGAGQDLGWWGGLVNTTTHTMTHTLSILSPSPSLTSPGSSTTNVLALWLAM